MNKVVKAAGIAAMISTVMAISAYAGEWAQLDEGSICFVKASGDICKSGWYWIDGNQDGVAECYYFDQDGKLLMNTVTPDELTVDVNGAWVQDGEVQKHVIERKQAASGVVIQDNKGFYADLDSAKHENKSVKGVTAVSDYKIVAPGESGKGISLFGYKDMTNQKKVHSVFEENKAMYREKADKLTDLHTAVWTDDDGFIWEYYCGQLKESEDDQRFVSYVLVDNSLNEAGRRFYEMTFVHTNPEAVSEEFVKANVSVNEDYLAYYDEIHGEQ